MKTFFFTFVAMCIAGASFGTDWQTLMRESSAPALVQNDMNKTASVRQQNSMHAKNPKTAFFLSAAIPGAGQVYAKSYVKAAAWMAVEVASWTLFAVKNQQGQDIRQEFRSYANSHWSEEHYWRWIAHHSGIGYSEDNIEALREWEHDHFSHGLHRNKDQQYYEMIGKYHQFNYGWDDFRDNYGIETTHQEMTDDFVVSDNRYHYESRRDAANDAFRLATTGTTVAMVNHILSALDAVWSTHRYNQKVQMSLRLTPMRFDTRTETALTLQMNW